jgi:uncharacterized protein
MAGVLQSRLPTLVVIIMTALFFAVVTLSLIPMPRQAEEQYSVRSRHEAEQALREAEASVTAAKQIPMPAAAGEQTHAAVAQETSEPPPSVAPLLQRQQPDKVALPPAPDMAVAERTPEGLLPAIADDGRRPWQVYARPYVKHNQPQIVVVVAGLGADRTVANAAIERLPGSITLAFDAAWAGRDENLARARQNGHETLLAIPAEPFDYPNSDPGPDTLLTSASPKENLKRLQHSLMQATGYVGILTTTGTRFLSVPKAMQVMLEEVAARGLALLDTRITERNALMEKAALLHLPIAAADFRVTSDLSEMAIDQVLAQAEFSAKKTGQAIILVNATPLAMDRLNHWLLTLPNSGIVIAPFTAVLR